MGTHWYVLQVMSGKEIAIRDALQQKGILSKVPQEERPLRRRGCWHYVPKVLFPGYVFLGCDALTPGLYYTAGAITGVVRFVGSPREQPITNSEAEQLAFLAPDNAPLPPSIIRVAGDATYITSGVLLALKKNIIKMERRQRRVRVWVQFLGEEKQLILSLRPEEEENGMQFPKG